jgi:hypothetical protein
MSSGTKLKLDKTDMLKKHQSNNTFKILNNNISNNSNSNTNSNSVSINNNNNNINNNNNNNININPSNSFSPSKVPPSPIDSLLLLLPLPLPRLTMRTNLLTLLSTMPLPRLTSSNLPPPPKLQLLNLLMLLSMQLPLLNPNTPTVSKILMPFEIWFVLHFSFSPSPFLYRSVIADALGYCDRDSTINMVNRQLLPMCTNKTPRR